MKKFPYYLFILFFLILMMNVTVFDRDCWFDESFSMLQVEKPWSGDGGVNGQNIFSVADVHPPLYYVTLKLFNFDGSIGGARTLSAIFGLLSLLILYLLLELKFGKEKNFDLFFGLFGMLYILASTNIHYFTEARMYSMGIFFCLLSFYSLVRLSGEKGDLFWLRVLFLVSTIALPFIHYYTVFFIFGELVYTWFFFKNKVERRRISAMWFASFIFMIPAAVYLFLQTSRLIGGWFLDSSWLSLLSTYHYALFYYNEGAVPVTGTILGLLFLLVSFTVIIWYIISLKDKDEKRFSLFLLFFFLMPSFLGMIINVFVMPLFHHRFFLFVGWIFMLLITRAFFKLAQVKKLRLALVIGIIFICGVLLMNFFTYFQTQNTELKVTADHLKQADVYFDVVGINETVVIIHESPWSMLPYMYYFRNFDTLDNYVYTTLPKMAFNRAGGDVIPNDRVLNDTKDIMKLDKYLYLWSDGSLHFDGFETKILKVTDGLNLTLETKQK